MSDRRTEVLLELASYATLKNGWDGEQACSVSPWSLYDALAYVFQLPAVPYDLEPSLHVDGTVILEWDEGRGYRRFYLDPPAQPTASPTAK